MFCNCQSFDIQMPIRRVIDLWKEEHILIENFRWKWSLINIEKKWLFRLDILSHIPRDIEKWVLKRSTEICRRVLSGISFLSYDIGFRRGALSENINTQRYKIWHLCTIGNTNAQSNHPNIDDTDGMGYPFSPIGGILVCFVAFKPSFIPKNTIPAHISNQALSVYPSTNSMWGEAEKSHGY